jgi:hypothetical protein
MSFDMHVGKNDDGLGLGTKGGRFCRLQQPN